MALSTFQGPVRSLAGFYSQGPNSVVNLANGTNTITLTVAAHAGKVIRTNDATLVITLPTISASTTDTQDTPNNIGCTYTIVVETSITTGSIVTDGTDKFVGGILGVDTDTGGAAIGYVPASTNDVMSFDGTTKGALAGTVLKFTALTTAKYLVEGILLGSGTVATPFADS
jgi:hypothetical protein